MLVPTILGYALITRLNYTRLGAARESGYHVLFRSALVGGVLFGLSELALFVLLDPHFPQVREVWNRLLPTDYFNIGVIIFVTLLIWNIGNRVYSVDEAQLRAARETGDVIELLISDAIREDKFVELSLRNRKSYIGIPLESGIGQQGQSDIAIIPLASGYRDKDTQELRITTHYAPVIDRLLDQQSPIPVEDFTTVIPISEIVSARIFHLEAYTLFQDQERDARF